MYVALTNIPVKERKEHAGDFEVALGFTRRALQRLYLWRGPTTAGPAALLLSAAHRMACLSLATFVFWLLVLQNAGVVLLMRYTRATRGESDYVPQV